MRAPSKRLLFTTTSTGGGGTATAIAVYANLSHNFGADRSNKFSFQICVCVACVWLYTKSQTKIGAAGMWRERERARKKSSESKTSVASTSKHYLLFMRAYIYHGGWHLTKHRRMKLSFRSKRNICARLLCYASVQLKTHENRHKSLWKNPISSFCVLRSTIASLALKFRFSRFAFRSTFLSSPSV